MTHKQSDELMTSSVPLIDSRAQFPQLIDQLGLKVGLEIGVCRGEYSALLLQDSCLDLLYGVDAWSTDEESTRSALKKCDKVPGKFERHYEVAKQALSKFGSRSKLLRVLSQRAADEFQENSLDFIYVDAAHRFTGVAMDLILWYPKLRVGGVMAGHDYWHKYRYEVMSAVNGFVVEKQQILNATCKERRFPIYPPTWWFIKQAWSKKQYFDALHRHLPRLTAVQAYLREHKVKISLPPEYAEEFARIGWNAERRKIFATECARIGFNSMPEPMGF